jgi:hypothetical protein
VSCTAVIGWIACYSSTPARDLAGLAGYSIERLTMIDLFPQTYHLEAVVRLLKEQPAKRSARADSRGGARAPFAG